MSDKYDMRNFLDIIYLNEDATDSTGAPLGAEFMTWFGRSQVVNARGEPLVLYHGTGTQFETFNSEMIWGSADAQLAYEYAQMREAWHGGKARLVPLYLKIERPFDADKLPNAVTVQHFAAAIQNQSASPITGFDDLVTTIRAGRIREESGPHYSAQDFWYETRSSFGADGAAAIRELYRRGGFDGIRLTEDGALTFGAFSSDQVKTVI